MGTPLRVLIVEDSADDAALVERELRRGGYAPAARRVQTADEMRAALAGQAWDLVLSDYALPGFSGPAALAQVRESGLDVPFIVVTGAITDDTAVAAMKAGAHDYVMKDNLRRLVPAVQRELREAEERRGRKQAEEARAALEVVARRAERLAALGTLAAGLAHELNNPIGIISSRIELMLLDAAATGLPESLAEDLRVIHRHAQRVARIAQGLLSFARNAPMQRGPVDLNQLIRDTVMLAERQFTRDGVAVDVALAGALPAIEGDPTALQQVILNLVINARDAIDGPGTVRIETAPLDGPGAGVRLAVSDTGRGIAREDLPRIFDPFFTTKARGSGLGLSITHGIVREHGGAIDVESQPGRGTRFVITLPAAPLPTRAHGL
jgi:signal transduction histidine kinase